MPSTLITTREGWIKDPRELLDAVQSALAETIGVALHARHLRLHQLPGDHVDVSGRGDRYVELQIVLLPGRTPEAKQALFAAVRRNLVPLGVPEADVKVILVESSKENWS